MRYHCPKCGSRNLDVCISTWARLVEHDDHLETDLDEAMSHDHEWDGDSAMLCRECSHSGKASDFKCYPMTPERAAALKPGDRIIWDDPDNGICSRPYTIKAVEFDESSGVLKITSTEGDCLECYLSEVSHFKAGSQKCAPPRP